MRRHIGADADRTLPVALVEQGVIAENRRSDHICKVVAYFRIVVMLFFRETDGSLKYYCSY